MSFDNLDINLVEQNFDHIVDKLIQDIDHLDEEQYLEKYKAYDLGLHRISDEEINKKFGNRSRTYFRNKVVQ